MQDEETQSKLKNLKLDWFIKGQKYMAYDFDMKDFQRVSEFVDEIKTSCEGSNSHPDMLIHKNYHIRLELYDKDKGNFGPKEVELAEKIENIFMNKFQNK
jgi:pterin-4a-carbinolamine dehydratase